jgi:hypothetical protein
VKASCSSGRIRRSAAPLAVVTFTLSRVLTHR